MSKITINVPEAIQELLQPLGLPDSPGGYRRMTELAGAALAGGAKSLSSNPSKLQACLKLLDSYRWTKRKGVPVGESKQMGLEEPAVPVEPEVEKLETPEVRTDPSPEVVPSENLTAVIPPSADPALLSELKELAQEEDEEFDLEKMLKSF